MTRISSFNPNHVEYYLLGNFYMASQIKCTIWFLLVWHVWLENIWFFSHWVLLFIDFKQWLARPEMKDHSNADWEARGCIFSKYSKVSFKVKIWTVVHVHSYFNHFQNGRVVRMTFFRSAAWLFQMWGHSTDLFKLMSDTSDTQKFMWAGKGQRSDLGHSDHSLNRVAPKFQGVPLKYTL